MSGKTILFADQVGSTRQLAEIGDEAAVLVRRRLQQLLVDTVNGNEGRIFSDDGDGCAAVFDDADNAARAALLMLEGATAARSEVEDKLAIHLRIGIHTGNVIPNGQGFVGLAVHIGARMCEVAPTDYIAVSEHACAAFTDNLGIRITPFGRRAMKGIAEPVAVSLLTNRSAAQPITTVPPDVALAGITIASSPWLAERATPLVVVERSDEAERLQAAISAATHQVQMVLVSGEPGVGKSTLVHQQVNRHAAGGRSLVLVGRCDENVDGPYREVVEALHHLVAEAPTQLLADHVVRHGSLLTRLIPGLQHRVPSASLTDSDQDVDPFRLYEAVADLLRSAAQYQPVTLILEDLHWASQPSLDLLNHIAKSAGLQSIVVIGTYRPTEVRSAKRTGEFVSRLIREPNVHRITVVRFSLQQTMDLVGAALARHRANPDLAEPIAVQLFEHTSGNPLFLAQMVRSLTESGRLQEIADSGVVATIAVPETVQELATARVDRLGERVATVLANASVLGSSFRLAELERLVDDRSIDVLELLETAEHAGLVQEEPSSLDGAFAFRHALIQNALYDRLGGTRKRRLHRAAATAIVAETGTRLKSRAADVLLHLDRCGSLATTDELFRIASLAADEASERIALVEAVRYRQIAVDALQHDDGADVGSMAQALLALGSAQTAVGHPEGRTSMVLAADAARAAGRWNDLALAAIGYGGALKENQASPVDDAIRLANDALVHHVERSPMRARLLVVKAVWQRQFVPYESRRVLVDEALEIARETGDQRTIAAVLSEFHRALHGPNAMPGAIAIADELEGLAAALADDDVAFQALNLRLLGAAALGQWDVAQQTTAQLAAMAERLRHIEGRRITLSRAVCVAVAQGRFGDASKHVATLRVLLDKYPAADSAVMFGALQFVEPWLGGHSAVLRKFSEHAATKAVVSPIWFAAEAGQLDDAKRMMADLPPVTDLNLRFNYTWWHDIVGHTRFAIRTGDQALAAQLVEVMEPYADGDATLGVVAFLGTGRFHLGTLHYVLGDADAAITNYEQSIERHEAMQAKPWVAFSEAELAVALEARNAPGDAGRAAVLRTSARTVADELKLGLVLETLDRPGGVLPND